MARKRNSVESTTGKLSLGMPEMTESQNSQEKRALVDLVLEDVQKAYGISRDRSVNKILERVISNLKGIV